MPYRAALAEMMKIAAAWHEKLETGELPSVARIGEFETRTASLNEKVAETWARYCRIGALLYKL